MRICSAVYIWTTKNGERAFDKLTRLVFVWLRLRITVRFPCGKGVCKSRHSQANMADTCVKVLGPVMRQHFNQATLVKGGYIISLFGTLVHDSSWLLLYGFNEFDVARWPGDTGNPGGDPDAAQGLRSIPLGPGATRPRDGMGYLLLGPSRDHAFEVVPAPIQCQGPMNCQLTIDMPL